MISITTETARLLQKDYGIQPEVTYELFRIGALTEQSCRNMLIKYEYFKNIEPKEKRRIKTKIADRYCVSVESVEKLTCKKFTNNVLK
jgi:ribosomal protein L23